MALDPQMKALLDQMAAANLQPFHKLTPQEARAARRAPQGDPEPVAHVEDRTIPGPGGEIPVRIYLPKGNAPFGVLVYFHPCGRDVGTYVIPAQTIPELIQAIRY